MSTSNRIRNVARVVLAFVVCLLAIWTAPGAGAACHSFTISGSTVAEGQAATVTVKRDNTLDESSVQIRTSNGTAKAPPDYKATITRVEFANEQSRTVRIPTAEDKVPEETETFQVKLGSARGCRSFNTDYQYGPPATVTIKDDDLGAPVPEVTATPAPTQRPRPTATPEDTPSPTPKKTPKPTPTPTETPEETVEALPTLAPEDDDDLNTGLLVVAAGAFLLAAILAVLLTRAVRGRP